MIARQSESKWNIPHCIGAMDMKHITITAPFNSGSFYLNYTYKKFIIVLLAVVDTDYKYMVVFKV